MDATIHANLVETAGKVGNYFKWLRENGLVAHFVHLMDGHTKSDILGTIAAGNGVAVAQPVPNVRPLTAAEVAKPKKRVAKPKGMVIHYASASTIEAVDGKKHRVFGSDGVPNYCLESGQGKYHNKWVPCSEARRNGIIQGSLMMTSSGHIITNPEWRAYIAAQQSEPSPYAVTKPAEMDDLFGDDNEMDEEESVDDIIKQLLA